MAHLSPEANRPKADSPETDNPKTDNPETDNPEPQGPEGQAEHWAGVAVPQPSTPAFGGDPIGPDAFPRATGASFAPNPSPVAAGSAAEYELLDVEAVQRVLGRSRASIYRYANTDPKGEILNLSFDPRCLNPEHRRDFQEPLLFHANEVARFARDVLRIQEVTVEVMETPQSQTQRLLMEILEELRQIRSFLAKQ